MDSMNRDDAGAGGDVRRRKLSVRRRLVSGDESYLPKKNNGSLPRLKLGENASNSLLSARACPGTDSPKRIVPMDIDTTTPNKKTRTLKNPLKTKFKGGKMSAPPSNQPLLTSLWKLGPKKNDEDNKPQ